MRGARSRTVFSAVIGVVALAALVGGLYLTGAIGASSRDAEETTANLSDETADPLATEPASNEEPKSAGDEQGDEPEAEAEEKDKKAPIPVNVSQIVHGTVSSYISATANLVPEGEVEVLAEAEGRVAKLLVEEGDRVADGQVLAQLVRDDAEIALRKAQVKADNTRLAYERGRKTLEADLLSQEDFDKLEMEHQVALQELAEAKWNLEKTTIRAPFAGRVTRRNVKLGQHVRPGDDLFTIADFDPLISYIFLPETDVFGLEVGREARITLKANDLIQFTGRIRRISPVVDTATGTVKITIEAIDPPETVRPGGFVTIDIVRETRRQAVLVPRDAVIRELQDAYVFVVNDDVAEKRAVALGIEEGDHVEALTGLEAGEQVIVAGQGGLKDGSPIKIIPSTEASDLSLSKHRPNHG